MNAKQIQAAVEAVLFAAGEPLELSRLAQALEVNEGLMEQILKNLEAQLENIRIVEPDGTKHRLPKREP